MIWVIRVGLFFVAILMVVAVLLKPAEIVSWLPSFGMVAMLALMAEGERRKRRGRSIWSGLSFRRISIWNLGLGLLFALVSGLLFMKESYIAAAFNLLGAIGLIVLSAFGLITVPNHAVEKGARKDGARQSS